MSSRGGVIRIIVCILLGSPLAIEAAQIEGRVIGISDGDTITLLDGNNQQHKIRLSGIDAPEFRQSFGQASKRNLSKMVFEREVVAVCGKTDKYRRLVCKVMIHGEDANIEQVKAGMAWWYRKYAREQSLSDQDNYAAAEELARSASKGLWNDPNPIAPWEWRKRQVSNDHR